MRKQGCERKAARDDCRAHLVPNLARDDAGRARRGCDRRPHPEPDMAERAGSRIHAHRAVRASAADEQPERHGGSRIAQWRDRRCGRFAVQLLGRVAVWARRLRRSGSHPCARLAVGARGDRVSVARVLRGQRHRRRGERLVLANVVRPAAPSPDQVSRGRGDCDRGLAGRGGPAGGMAAPMIRLAPAPGPVRILFLAVPLAGIFVGATLMRTEHQVHWVTGVAYAVGTVAIAANLAFQFVTLRFLVRVLRRRGVMLLEGVEPIAILALLAAGTAVSAGLVLAAVRIQPGLTTVATAMFPGLTLVVAMAGALLLAPGHRLGARRALVLVFASQFLLSLCLRLL